MDFDFELSLYELIAMQSNPIQSINHSSTAISKVFNLKDDHKDDSHHPSSPSSSQSNVKSKSRSNKITSVHHQFKPAVELSAAIEWLQKNGAQDAMLVFDNESGLTFDDFVFADFESFDADGDGADQLQAVAE